MKLTDITIIYLTASLIPEKFAQRQREILLSCIGDTPIISVSRKPLDFGQNLLDTEEKSISNIYRQMLRASKLVTTPYIAIAEDDTFYCEEHFTFARPPLDSFLYNMNRFALFTWGIPTYSMRDRISNASLIAPTGYLIDALTERFDKWPDGTPHGITGEVGREMVEKNLGISIRKCIKSYSSTSIIQFNHASSSEEIQQTKRKRMGMVRAFDIPHWGRAQELVRLYE